MAAVCQRRADDRTAADRFGATLYTDIFEMAREEQLDGIVIACPTHLHLPAVKASIAGAAARCAALKDAGEPAEAGLRAILVEKPICGDLAESVELVRCADAAGVAVLVGHQRRHSVFVRRAMELVQSPDFGPLRGVNAEFALLKPDTYYRPEDPKMAWRTQPGQGGPVLINMIHDLDLLRYITGHEISKVYAVTSSMARANAVEDTGAITVTFDHGAVGTMLFSDAAPSPWSYEFTTGENKKYPQVPGGTKDCYNFLGAQKSLAFPSLQRFGYGADANSEPGWDSALSLWEEEVQRVDPIQAQMAHFVRVCRAEEQPVCSGQDAIASLAVAVAVLQSAETGLPVQPGDMFEQGTVSPESPKLSAINGGQATRDDALTCTYLPSSLCDTQSEIAGHGVDASTEAGTNKGKVVPQVASLAASS